MILKDIEKYAKRNWTQFLSSITVISDSGNNRGPLVTNGKVIYHFDSICESLFPTGLVPTSADGLSITADVLALVEFKSGFKQRITKRSFDAEKATCSYTGLVCNEYWELFFENQKRKREELITSIRFKAIESFITIEKKILPLCDDIETHRPLKVKFVVVIDEVGVDSMEDTLAELAGLGDIEDNCYVSIKQALSRLKTQVDAGGNAYYYDCIEVMSAQDFSNFLQMGT